MRDRFTIWRERSWTWWAPLLFLALNLGSILFFQSTFAGQLDKMESNYDQRAERLQSYKDEVEGVEEFLRRVDEQDQRIGALYRDYFATESERFTRVLREIRTLARRAGLDPRSFSYPDSEIGAYDLNRLGIRFSVDGTYDQLRTFINFLELTDQFLALESVTLTGGKGDRDARLQIRFGVSTIFAQNDAESLELPEELPGETEEAFDAEDDPSSEDEFLDDELLDEEGGARVEGMQDEEASGIPDQRGARAEEDEAT